MSKVSINALVIGLFALPFIGAGMAFYTGNMAWLLLLFFLAVFL
jgi:hypothetical protein